MPHAFLHLVPLHACRRHDPRSGQTTYLCEEFDIAYLPSAALLPQLPALRAWDGSVLSVANPERGTPLTLPFSEWEARSLRSRLSLSQGRFYAGPDATIANAMNWEERRCSTSVAMGVGKSGSRPVALAARRRSPPAHDVMYRCPPVGEGAVAVLNGCETAVRDLAQPTRRWG